MINHGGFLSVTWPPSSVQCLWDWVVVIMLQLLVELNDAIDRSRDFEERRLASEIFGNNLPGSIDIDSDPDTGLLYAAARGMGDRLRSHRNAWNVTTRTVEARLLQLFQCVTEPSASYVTGKNKAVTGIWLSWKGLLRCYTTSPIYGFKKGF